MKPKCTSRSIKAKNPSLNNGANLFTPTLPRQLLPQFHRQRIYLRKQPNLIPGPQLQYKKSRDAALLVKDAFDIAFLVSTINTRSNDLLNSTFG